MNSKSLIVLAGAALGMSGGAFAEQSAWSANADEVRALVSEMMADSQTRSSLLQSGGVAGHDGHFFLAAPDDSFRLEVSGQIQFRYVANFRDDDFGDSDAEETIGFQTRRTKLSFDGHIYDPNLFYHITGAFNRGGGFDLPAIDADNDGVPEFAGGNFGETGGFALEDAYVGYRFGNGMSVRWGQFKLPFLREELVSSKRQLAADRSVVNEVFNQGRSQGIELSFGGEQFRGMVAISDGFGSANTDFTNDPSDFAITGRVEALLSGDWRQFRDFTSMPGSDAGFMIGGALHYEIGSDETNTADDKNFSYTIDASYEANGWNLFGAFVGRHFDPDVGDDRDDFGFVLQGGVFLSEQWELFGRYDMYLPDDDNIDLDDFSTITAGVNYYLHGHAAKFTFDVQWFLDSTLDSGLGDNTGIGLLASDEDDQFALRAQFQLLF